MQSTPVGYADDLAASCLFKYKEVKVMDLVSRHRCMHLAFYTERVVFKCFGNKRCENSVNTFFSEFRLSPDKV